VEYEIPYNREVIMLDLVIRL
jgi:hypothetical protein